MWPLGFPLTSQMDSVHSLPLHSPPAWSYSSPASVNGAPHPHCMVRAVGSRAAQKDGALPQGGRDPPLKAPHWSLTLLLSLCPLQFLALKVGNSTDFLSKFSFFLFGCARSSLLCRLFASCGEWGYSPVAVHSFLTAVASLVQHRLQGTQASVLVALGL